MLSDLIQVQGALIFYRDDRSTPEEKEVWLDMAQHYINKAVEEARSASKPPPHPTPP